MSDDVNQADLFGAETEALAAAPTHIEDFITARMLTPSMRWISEEIVLPGVKGKQVDFATIVGIATDVSRQSHKFGEEMVESVKLEGEFEALSLITGEVWASGVAYLPMKWAKLVEAALMAIPKDDPNRKAKMILTLGIRATGNPAQAYAWTVSTNLERRVSPDMAQLRAVASGPQLRLAGRGAPPTIEAEAA